jgi:hypothetical protein
LIFAIKHRTQTLCPSYPENLQAPSN